VTPATAIGTPQPPSFVEGRHVARTRGLRALLLALASIAGPWCSHADAAASRHRRVQIGDATYYSRAFDGQTTASGCRFDGRALVAAHRTLPFGTLVRVTNLENGRRVRVRIVDRGPFGDNRREGAIVDLSPAAARRVGMLKDGQVRARVEILRLGAQDTRGACEGPPRSARKGARAHRDR
jgi:rare lipoprotein A